MPKPWPAFGAMVRPGLHFRRQPTPAKAKLASTAVGGVGGRPPAGQKRTVTTYRLLTAGTIDEKIYQRQLSKQALSDVVMVLQTSDLRKHAQIKGVDKTRKLILKKTG